MRWSAWNSWWIQFRNIWQIIWWQNQLRRWCWLVHLIDVRTGDCSSTGVWFTDRCYIDWMYDSMFLFIIDVCMCGGSSMISQCWYLWICVHHCCWWFAILICTFVCILCIYNIIIIVVGCVMDTIAITVTISIGLCFIDSAKSRSSQCECTEDPLHLQSNPIQSALYCTALYRYTPE
jgi:hypothetical protein